MASGGKSPLGFLAHRLTLASYRTATGVREETLILQYVAPRYEVMPVATGAIFHSIKTWALSRYVILVAFGMHCLDECVQIS